MINDLCLSMHFRSLHILTLCYSSCTRVNFIRQLQWIIALGFANQHSSLLSPCMLIKSSHQQLLMQVLTPRCCAGRRGLSVALHNTEKTATTRLNAKKSGAIFIKINIYLLVFIKHCHSLDLCSQKFCVVQTLFS